MKNPVLFWIVVIFTSLNILDMFTTLFILPGESNPLFLVTGKLWPIFLVKILINVGVIVLYKRNVYPNVITYYLLLTALTIGISLFTLAQYANIRAIISPNVLQEASSISVQEKVNSYTTIIIFLYLIPLFFSVISFILYNKSRKKIRISKKYYKKRKWWQF